MTNRIKLCCGLFCAALATVALYIGLVRFAAVDSTSIKPLRRLVSIMAYPSPVLDHDQQHYVNTENSVTPELKPLDLKKKYNINFNQYLPDNVHIGPPGNGYKFSMNGTDVMVFLHIQKTGGTEFGKHLVKDLRLKQPCVCTKGLKVCDCFRPNSEDKSWLFSRFSTGWRCGLHAGWTELISCVDDAINKRERISEKRK